MKGKQWVAVVICVVSIIFAPRIGSATPIDFDEAVSGDLGSATSPFSPFVFGVGTNTISGTVEEYHDLDGPVTTIDSFFFKLLGGTEIVSASIELTALTLTPPYFSLSLGLGIGELFSPRISRWTPHIDILAASLGDTTQMASEFLPITQNYYTGLIGALGGHSSTLDASFTMSYKATYVVRQVPEPSTFMLVAIGLVSLARVRRSRCTAA